ncbi:auxin efflux carrier [Dactylonectria estremocensis]|uniref:Auxin efflux carrier n=1 Tax=Dactylonectria estremocensis TaxID=1079267 RepID=A0A9P9DK82_9HYPO|nr:auxin efflux carrier [Dactylonectria estremocensis]
MNSIRAIAAPTSYRLSRSVSQNYYDMHMQGLAKSHDSHTSLPHLCVLVFEAVLEVVCVILPGYIIARLGHLDTEKQKFLANLNVMLFTPCLIFTKLASQLTTEKLSELSIIPVIFAIQTFVSWGVSVVVGRLFGFSRRSANFVTALGVFGNSNSLPISLVLSLSQTIKELHWDKIPGDNDDEVGARGILYLLIFQQLGQLVRWSWGYHVLLAPREKYPEYQQEIAEEGQSRHEEGDEHETQTLIGAVEGGSDSEDDRLSIDSQGFDPAGRTPLVNTSRVSLAISSHGNLKMNVLKNSRSSSATPVNESEDGGDIYYFPRISPIGGNRGSNRFLASTMAKFGLWKSTLSEALERRYEGLPHPVQSFLSFLKRTGAKFNNFIWEFMNPPLWAMLIAMLIVSTPSLQRFFFEEGSLVRNSVTNAIRSSGDVAVPLILVVLGANLACNTMPTDETLDPEEERYGNKLLIASLFSRMLLPTIVMVPILALIAMYLPISILDDPIFVIVCFLLTGAPSALQLAQICQINSIFVKTMGRVLFQSYVIWILPSTLVLVILALEIVEWSK